MEEAVVGAVVRAAVQTALQSLLPVLKDETYLIWNFKSDFQKLQQSFLMIEDVLCQADMQHVTDRPVKRWLRKLESLAYEADNVLDEFNYQVLRKKLDLQKKMRKKVRNFFTQSNPIALRRKLGRKIRDINKNLELINQEASSFGLQSRLARVASAGLRETNVIAVRETDSFTVDPIVVGREDDIWKIVNMLTTSSTGHQFSIVPIVGMGGLGKTTLARLVLNHERIKNHFGKLIWVYVSENFDALAIFNKFLGSLKGEEARIQNREVVLRELNQELGNKNYLLVLDDIWNEDASKWDNFINSLSGISSARGNGVIVTTRSENVASIVRTLPVYRLTSLSEENCWSIIKAKTFKGQEVPIDFERMGNDIAKRCQGLPLAANVVGGVLLDKSKDQWFSIQQNWLSGFIEDENLITQILKLSFDNLPSPVLKKCFAYCSIFKKGHPINPNELIELWMAEGFLQIDGPSDMEATGSKFFDLLLQNSLLQVEERNQYGDITKCSMHDLVHDLACYVLGSRSNSGNDNILDDTYRVRYIEIEYMKDDSCLLTHEQVRCFRTLFFRGQVPNKILSEFKSLHTLILIGEDIENLPILIGTLIHLRCLCIMGTRIETLPDSIGELYHLQTLRIGHHCERLPNTITKLINLRHLHIPKNIELPLEMGQLASLRTLQYFKVGIEKGRRISELGSLKNLKGELEIYNLEMVRDKDEAKSADLFHKVDLYRLKLAWNEPIDCEINDEDVLEGLQPHPNLKSLEIYGFGGRRLSLWASKMVVRNNNGGNWIGFNSLVKMELLGCLECEEVPTLGHLPNLKILYLDNLPNVKSLSSSFYQDEKCCIKREPTKKMNILFPMLEKFLLSRMPNLLEWVEIGFSTVDGTQLNEVVAFPRLKCLKIRFCKRLRTTPSHFPCLKEFEISGVDSVSPFINICSHITSLTELQIGSMDNLICLPHNLFFNNQNLSLLSVDNCANIRYLVPRIGKGRTSLKELTITFCPNLEKLPDDLYQLSFLEVIMIHVCGKLKLLTHSSDGQSLGFISLRHLDIWDCAELTTLPVEMVKSFAPTIERLSLLGLNLSNLNMVLGSLKEMSCLTDLEISGVPKPAISPVEIGSLCSLEKFSFGPFSDSLGDPHSFNEALESIWGGVLQRIHGLELFGELHWDSLPDKLQDLTTLTYLHLHDFGVESLPEWFGNLSSLETLELSDCTELMYLPSKEAMQRLTKLKSLQIWCCDLLAERFLREEGSSSNDSEWAKISHIPRLMIWPSERLEWVRNTRSE